MFAVSGPTLEKFDPPNLGPEDANWTLQFSGFGSQAGLLCFCRGFLEFFRN